MKRCTWWSPVLCVLFGAAGLGAPEYSHYRGFQLGADLATTAKQAGLKPSEARLVHQRPAVIQELDWRPAPSYETETKRPDSVQDVMLRFYNGELFQIVTTYERQSVEGMTDADMVEAISSMYGVATNPVAKVAYHSFYGETASVIARWEDAEHSHNLVRTGDGTSYALILNLRRLEALAQAAMLESVRLDALEAPQRAIELQKRKDADRRIELEKARIVNKTNFRP